MMRSLFAGVSGLRNHQTRMDVIGNNIANVNTVGFKASRVNFQDVLCQTMQDASGSNGTTGGTNPIQVGLGMGLASIDTLFTDGSFQPTGKLTDLSIQGSGFFILADGANRIYTRAGNFDFDQQGNYLVPGNGFKVMGWMADSAGTINTAGPIAPIQIPVGATMPPRVSTRITDSNNLSSEATVGTTSAASINVFDSLGASHKVNQTFINTGERTWLCYTNVPDAVTGTLTGTLREITFSDKGEISNIASVTPTAVPSAGVTMGATLSLNNTADSVNSQYFTAIDSSGAPKVFRITFSNTDATHWNYKIYDASSSSASPTSIADGTATWDGTTYTFSDTNFTYNGDTFALNTPAAAAAPGAATVFAYTANYTTGADGPLTFTPPGGAASMSLTVDLSGIRQYGGSTTVQITGQDGYAAGTLQTVSADSTGTLIGKFSNGQSQNLGQVALAIFNNPAGLTKSGDNLYMESNNSGVPQIGTSGTGGRGSLTPGTLEMSNVDLAQEFSNMIITERGFQANSKIITTTDEMLQELTNLKR